MQILPQIKAQIFADCKTKRKKLRKQKRKNNRKIPLAPYSTVGLIWSMDYQTIQCLHLLTFKHHDCLQNFLKAPTNDQVHIMLL